MKVLNIFFILLITSVFVFAQGGGSDGISNPRAAAMGKTSVVSSRGVFALGINPANMAISQDHNWEFSTIFPIPNLSFFVGNDFMNINDYNYFFGGVTGANGKKVGRYLDETDKARFKSLFNDGTNIRANFSADILSLAYNAGLDVGAFGFSIKDRFGTSVSIPIDMINLILDGNKIGKVYNFNDTKLRAFYLREYSLSYARQLQGFLPGIFQNINAGFSIKLVQGFAYIGTGSVDATFETLNDHSLNIKSNSVVNIATSPAFGIEWDFDKSPKSSNVNPFPTPAGSGIGFDIGLSGQIDSVWSFGFAITDVGSIKWDKETVHYSSVGSFLFNNFTDSVQVDSLSNTFEPKGSYSNGFTTKLPTALRFGVGMQLDKLIGEGFPGKMLVVFGYNQGFNNEPTNSTKPRFSLGFEWKLLSWLPIRSGFSFGGIDKFNWGFGFGADLGILDLDFATTDLNNVLNGDNAKHIGVSISSRWKF